MSERDSLIPDVDDVERASRRASSSSRAASRAVAGSSEKFRRLACVVGERVFVDVSGDDSDSDDSDDSDAVKRNDFGVSFWDYPTIEASWA